MVPWVSVVNNRETVVRNFEIMSHNQSQSHLLQLFSCANQIHLLLYN